MEHSVTPVGLYLQCLDTAITTQLQEQVSFYKQNQLYVKQSVSSGVQGVTLNITFGELAHAHTCMQEASSLPDSKGL